MTLHKILNSFRATASETFSFSKTYPKMCHFSSFFTRIVIITNQTTGTVNHKYDKVLESLFFLKTGWNCITLYFIYIRAKDSLCVFSWYLNTYWKKLYLIFFFSNTQESNFMAIILQKKYDYIFYYVYIPYLHWWSKTLLELPLDTP